MRCLYRAGQKVAEKMSQRISSLHKENCFCECVSVDQLTNEELVRSYPTPVFLYSYNYIGGGIAVEVDPEFGKRFLRQDCGKYKEVSDFAVLRLYGCTVLRFCGCTVVRLYGFAVLRLYGCTVVRLYGFAVVRLYGYTVLRSNGFSQSKHTS